MVVCLADLLVVSSSRRAETETARPKVIYWLVSLSIDLAFRYHTMFEYEYSKAI